MRNLVAVGALVALAGCAAQSSAPPVVSWQYGTGAGDGVQYQGAAPAYARAYGMGAGDGVVNPVKPTVNYAYGAESQSGTMIQLAPQPRTVVAAPAAPPANTHS